MGGSWFHSPCQEQGFFAKVKISLPRARFLCQEQSFFAKGQRNLGGGTYLRVKYMGGGHGFTLLAK